MLDLKILNSATKYPSIQTYHALGEKGRLTDNHNVTFSGDLVVTEKVDGTNTRLIFMPDGNYLIGSREQLLYAKGDLIGDPALGIVASIKSLAERLDNAILRTENVIKVLFLETYGGKTTAAAKQYTGHQKFGHRLFDVITIDSTILAEPIDRIAKWREGGGQKFYTEDALLQFSEKHNVALTERLAVDYVPSTHRDVLDWLEAIIPHTYAALDNDARKQAEGVVVRTKDRSKVAKIRFTDYRRTLKAV